MRGLTENRITTLESDEISADIFLSEASFVPDHPPAMVMQVYDAESDNESSIWFGETEARELLSHLQAFLYYCKKRSKNHA